MFFLSAGETSDFTACSWTSTQNNSCRGMLHFVWTLKFYLLVRCLRQLYIWCLF